MPAGSQLQHRVRSTNATLASGPTTVTAASWAAAESDPLFIVGGVYDLQPYDLTMAPGATLTIDYTDQAVAGMDESQIVLLRWDPQGNHWQPVPAQADLARNTFTAAITQLGTYALGYDAAGPTSTLLDPIDGSSTENALPRIAALVRDGGSGVEPTSVQMQLDGGAAPATLNIGSGEMAYLPDTELSAGLHRVNVTAPDMLGNTSSATFAFTVGNNGRTYLPLIQRK